VSKAAVTKPAVLVPPGFQVRRATPVGRHPILSVFPGLDAMETAARQEPDGTARARLHQETLIEIVASDVWMYVAPWNVPRGARGRWRPVTTPGADTIVVGRSHLKESSELILFLDIFHELCHVRQRHAGRELFPEGVSYVRRSTEVEAYRFVVAEARRLGVPDDELREYLTVEWIDHSELLELLDAVGVSHPE